jgi:hypothetical protein
MVRSHRIDVSNEQERDVLQLTFSEAIGLRGNDGWAVSRMSALGRKRITAAYPLRLESRDWSSSQLFYSATIMFRLRL